MMDGIVLAFVDVAHIRGRNHPLSDDFVLYSVDACVHQQRDLLAVDERPQLHQRKENGEPKMDFATVKPQDELLKNLSFFAMHFDDSGAPHPGLNSRPKHAELKHRMSLCSSKTFFRAPVPALTSTMPR